MYIQSHYPAAAAIIRDERGRIFCFDNAEAKNRIPFHKLAFETSSEEELVPPMDQLLDTCTHLVDQGQFPIGASFSLEIDEVTCFVYEARLSEKRAGPLLPKLAGRMRLLHPVDFLRSPLGAHSASMEIVGAAMTHWRQKEKNSG